MRTTTLGGVVAAALALLVPATALALEFRPFFDHPNVCPGCQPGRFDKLRLTDGREGQAWIVAENAVFFLLERHGELRALPRARVAGVTAASDPRPPAGEHRDQILFKGGHLVSGRIVAEHPHSGHLELVCWRGRYTHLAHRSQIARIFRDGRESAP